MKKLMEDLKNTDYVLVVLKQNLKKKIENNILNSKAKAHFLHQTINYPLPKSVNSPRRQSTTQLTFLFLKRSRSRPACASHNYTTNSIVTFPQDHRRFHFHPMLQFL